MNDLKFSIAKSLNGLIYFIIKKYLSILVILVIPETCKGKLRRMKTNLESVYISNLQQLFHYWPQPNWTYQRYLQRFPILLSLILR